MLAPRTAASLVSTQQYFGCQGRASRQDRVFRGGVSNERRDVRQRHWMTPHCTVTAACAPLIVMACMAGSRAPPRVMVNEDCPGAFAMKVNVTTAPWPETPPAPGGRVAVTCRVPVDGSSR